MTQQQGLMPAGFTTYTEMLAFCERIATTSFVPDGMRGNGGAVLACLQTGLELGVPPMAALRNIHIIQGRPSLSADLMLALAHATKDLETYDEYYDAKTFIASVTIKRRGRPEKTYTFSKAEADLVPAKENDRAIKLSEKTTYKAWPQRMYLMRARTTGLRTEFPDLFAGMYSPEEIRDADEVIESQTVGNRDITTIETTVDQRSPWDRYPDADHVRIEEAFKSCSITPAAQRTLLRQYDGKSDALIDAMKTEWATRQGRPRQPQLTAATDTKVTGPSTQPSTGPSEAPKQPKPQEQPKVGPSEVKKTPKMFALVSKYGTAMHETYLTEDEYANEKMRGFIEIRAGADAKDPLEWCEVGKQPSVMTGTDGPADFDFAEKV